ncbi:MAG: Smr/MutS family protein [Pararhizobium sp.]
MSRERKLTHEDRVLWSKVARSTHPLPGRMEALLSSGASAPPPSPSAAALPQALKAAGAAPASPPRASTRREPALQPIERPVHRRIAKGRLPLDARLDLHGLFQDEAHDLLQAFLFRAHARGLRHVLVITGKGSSRGSDGVLKRAVPQWLAKPEFRWLVSGCEEAARTHGGEGALYIRLKRDKGGRP